MTKGYKAFRKGLVTQSNTILEVGKTYKIDGDIKWNNSGFHFCTNPEDTLRYMTHFEEEIEVALVHSDGIVYSNDDEYNGYYDMFVSDEITVDRVLSREELFNLIVSRGEPAIIRMIQTYKLNSDEIKFLTNKSSNIDFYLSYYQQNNEIIKNIVVNNLGKCLEFF